MSRKTSRAIGIDLGTTYTCASVFQNGQPTVISTADGDRTLESLIAFMKQQIVYGNSAKSMLSNNPKCGAANPKRFIGRGYDEDDVKKALSLLKYNIKRKGTDIDANKKDNIVYTIERGVENEPMFEQCPVTISAYILKHVKEYCERYLGHEVTQAVITVPAHFNDNQRQMTLNAAKIAKFTTVKLLNEPTAAAMAYAYKEQLSDRGLDSEQNVFVFDLGGGTFDVSFLELGDKLDEGSSLANVVATDGDVFLGGLDWDRILVNLCLDYWKMKHKNTPELLNIGEKQTRRLLNACEKAKRTLSNADFVNIDIDCFVGGESFNHRVTRAQFENASRHLRQRCISIIRRCLLTVALKDSAPLQLKDYKYDSEGILITTAEEDRLIEKASKKIDKVLMVGGSSRIPAIHKDLNAFFKREGLLSYEIHPDEAVAMGASYYAAMVAGDSDMAPEQMICLLDTTPFALGIETQYGMMAVIIPQGTTISARKSQIFTTAADNQTAVNISIYEGNSARCAKNNLLGQFVLTGIPPAPRGVPQIEVTMEISTDSILKVYAVDKGSSKKSEITVEALGKYSKEDIERMTREFEKMEEEDNQAKRRIDALVTLENGVFGMKNSLKEMKIDENTKSNLMKEIEVIEAWMQANPDATADDYNKKNDELKEIISKAAQSNPNQGAPTAEEVQ